MRYRVVYAIDVHAESSLEAVLQAYAGMIAPEMHPVFDVYREEEFIAQVDLSNLHGSDPTAELSFDALGDHA